MSTPSSFQMSSHDGRRQESQCLSSLKGFPVRVIGGRNHKLRPRSKMEMNMLLLIITMIPCVFVILVNLVIFIFLRQIQFDEKVAVITRSLRARMRFYKLRVTPNAAHIASTFNEQFKPETIQEHNDPFRVDWITEPPDSEDVLVGEKVTKFKFRP